jgi:hypothetical protein
MVICEWNPAKNKPARYLKGYTGPTDGCQNEATVCVGSNGQWHLCSECAKLPKFKRFKKKRLRQPWQPDFKPINGNKKPRPFRRKLTKKTIKYIMGSSLSSRKIAKELGVSKALILSARKGDLYE